MGTTTFGTGQSSPQRIPCGGSSATTECSTTRSTRSAFRANSSSASCAHQRCLRTDRGVVTDRRTAHFNAAKSRSVYDRIAYGIYGNQPHFRCCIGNGDGLRVRVSRLVLTAILQTAAGRALAAGVAGWGRHAEIAAINAVGPTSRMYQRDQVHVARRLHAAAAKLEAVLRTVPES